jgi:hypothetical protein
MTPVKVLIAFLIGFAILLGVTVLQVRLIGQYHQEKSEKLLLGSEIPRQKLQRNENKWEFKPTNLQPAGIVMMEIPSPPEAVPRLAVGKEITPDELASLPPAKE